MSYLGRTENKSSDIRRFDVTSSTSATHTLTWTPPNELSLIVTINGVKQHEDAYSVSGTTLTLTSALVAEDKLEVIGISDIGTTITPAQGSVNTDQLANDAVTADKLANSINTEITANTAKTGITSGQASAITANTAKVTNATHTGDVTGATALTIADDAVTSAKLADSAYLANRNRIINGNFDLWQRGTSFTGVTATGYQADRWEVQPAAGCTMTITRQAFTAGQTDVPYEPTYFLRTDITTAGSANAEISQKIEDVRTFAGQTVIASFYAKSTAGTQTLGCRFHQDFGSGGSTRVTTGISSKVLTSSWQKFSFTLTLGSVSGKTIGSNSWLGFNFYWPNSDTANDVDLAQVQVEAGSTVTPFEHKGIGQEIADCRRYYEKSYSLGTAPGTANQEKGVQIIFTTDTMAGSASIRFGGTHYSEVKRGNPTITIYSREGTSGCVSNCSLTTLAADSGTAAWIGDTGFAMQMNATSTITPANGGFCWQWAADAEL